MGRNRSQADVSSGVRKKRMVAKGGGETNKTARGGARKKRTRRKSKAKMISHVIERIEEKLESDEVKASVGDYIRLLQLERELEEKEQPKEIRVSWVERDEKDCASEK
mgnify:CR=1 FL=1